MARQKYEADLRLAKKRADAVKPAWEDYLNSLDPFREIYRPKDTFGADVYDTILICNAPNPLTKSALTNEEVQYYARELNNGRTHVDKFRKRPNISAADIKAFEIAADKLRDKDRTHDKYKIIDELRKSEDALREAIEYLKEHPDDDAALEKVMELADNLQSIRDAQKQVIKRNRKDNCKE